MKIQSTPPAFFSSSSLPPVWEPSRRAAGAARPAPPMTSTGSITTRKRCRPINYPASPSPRSTRSRCTVRPSITPRASASCRSTMPPAGVTRGPSLLRLLFEERRHRQIQAAGLVPLQRRPGRRHRLAAHGRVRPQDGEDEARMAWRLRRPTRYVDNPNCLLDTGDLVFIDAMGTGLQPPRQAHYRSRISAAWRTTSPPSASSSAAS